MSCEIAIFQCEIKFSSEFQAITIYYTKQNWVTCALMIFLVSESIFVHEIEFVSCSLYQSILRFFSNLFHTIEGLNKLNRYLTETFHVLKWSTFP